MPFFQKFTKKYKQVLSLAYQTARQDRYDFVLPEHIFFSLLVQKGSLAFQIFKKSKITIKQLKKELNIAPCLHHPKTNPLLAKETKNIIKKSAILAFNLKHPFIGTEHILFSFLKTNTSSINNFLLNHKIDPSKLKEQLDFVLKNISKLYSFPPQSFPPPFPEELEDFFADNSPLKKEADFFEELTDPLISKNFDPLIGREKEISQIIKVLGRRKKNNPLLIGEPGVGKTALVEGLAKKIIEMQAPSFLLGKKIIRIDLSRAIAGTIYRGEFEARLKNILEEAQKQNTILFIDEIHNIVGAGSSQGSLDAANILKPALANSQITLIGATTFSDYKKYLEKDKALIRRFEKIKVLEPNLYQTEKILQQSKEYYEKYHQVKISSETISAAVHLSDRYLTNKHQPDKALDLLDQAASMVKIKKQKNNFSFIENKLRDELKNIQDQKSSLVSQEDYANALRLKAIEHKVKEELKIVSQLKNEEKSIVLGEVKVQDIKETLSEMLQVPLTQDPFLVDFKIVLSQRIIGQNKVLEKLDKYLKKASLGVNFGSGPLASFFFLGPSGVGKTETARQIAKLIFKLPSSFLKLDMSEFGEKFNISRLIGAPAGYVGYEEGGKLTEFVKHHPYSLILFDEIEKAHPDISNILLQILEDGVLTDAQGETVNFQNTIIILTSNLGTKEFYSPSIGFTEKNNWEEIKKVIREKLQKSFRPEVLNRFDKILIFDPLEQKDLEKIIRRTVKELEKKIRKTSPIKITLSPAAVKYLGKVALSQKQGARGVKKLIQEKVENEVIDFLLENKKEKTITLEKGNLCLKKMKTI